MENMEMINEVMNEEEVTAIAEAIPEVISNENGNAVGKIVFAVGTLIVTIVGLTISIKRRKAKGDKRTKRNFLEEALIRRFEKRGYTVVKLDDSDEIDEEDVTIQDI